MSLKILKFLLTIVSIGLACQLGWMIYSRIQSHEETAPRTDHRESAPVEVAPIVQETIELRRTFSGALVANAKIVVSPKVGGRIKRLTVDIADTVSRGQIVAELDDDEFSQGLTQAKADLRVAYANLAEAESALEITRRELRRVETLKQRGVASDTQYDVAKAEELTKQAKLEVTKAQLIRSEASVETANIRLGYTKVIADWSGGHDHRVVAEKRIEEGATVSANTPLLSIVELDPIIGVIFVTEKDYVLLNSGQSATLTTDAYPDEVFEGRIDRIAPVFRESTRQARVELKIGNGQRRLRPGMFIRATVVLDQALATTIVPEQALTIRQGQTGIFIVDDVAHSVSWRAVSIGIRDRDRVQVLDQGVSGRVVVLGQHLLSEGSSITIPGDNNEKSGTGNRTPGNR